MQRCDHKTISVFISLPVGTISGSNDIQVPISNDFLEIDPKNMDLDLQKSGFETEIEVNLMFSPQLIDYDTFGTNPLEVVE